MKKEFTLMRKELEAYDSKREQLIKQSRAVLKTAKQLIYSIQRADMKQAKQQKAVLLKEKAALDRLARPTHLREGSYSEACQEYVEALTLYDFETGNDISSAKKLRVSTPDYLMGLSDLTGELVRLAVAYSTKGEYLKTEKIKDFTEDLWGEFLRFDFRNSQLRKKFDSMKYNVAKLESMMYDISMRK